MTLPDSIRTDLIFLPDDGMLERHDGYVVILTPTIPTFWWGNYLLFDSAPAAGDLQRWTGLFNERVRARQPASTHTLLAWTGAARGEVDPFIAAGYVYVELMVMSARSIRVAPHREPSVQLRRLSGPDWDQLSEFLVETRDRERHTEAGFRTFVLAKVAQWRALAEAGQGDWYGAYAGTQLVAAMGLYAEKQSGADGRRLGRFQFVVTHPDWRRRGLCGMLVEYAARHAQDRFGLDTLIIVADENDVARRVYAAMGFETVDHLRGLELDPVSNPGNAK